MTRYFAVFAALSLAAACSKQAPAAKTAEAPKAATAATTPAQDKGAEAKPAEAKPALAKVADPNAALAKAVVGQAAPVFKLPGVDGKTVSLADFKGKVVVLEWYNPDCPFVKWAHNEGPLKTMAADFAKKDVVWLAINSGAPGKQGHGLQRNKTSLTEYALAHPILLDESGVVGKAYGATNTPQMYVVDKDGTLVYGGGLDNLPFGELRDQGPARKHCEEALTDVLGGNKVRVPTSKAWGCTVKYGA